MVRTKRCGFSLEELYREEFERLCAQLLRNDPETCTTSVTHSLPYNSESDPEDASHRIAEALAGNTIVSNLDLQLVSREATASLETYDCLRRASGHCYRNSRSAMNGMIFGKLLWVSRQQRFQTLCVASWDVAPSQLDASSSRVAVPT
jgi:hypothetical protein